MSEAVVTAADVEFDYGRGAVLGGVSFEVERGSFVALVGPNGSGKSTLLRVLLGLLRPTSGRALLFGVDPHDLVDRGRLGYVPQRPPVAADLPGSVGEVVEAGRLSRTGWRGRLTTVDHVAVDRALEATGMTELAGRRLADLSGGQQQRVHIARALASEPELLILDEPTTGVDADSQHRFHDAVAGLGLTVLLVSHELSAVADLVERILVLKSKIVFDGSPTELRDTGVSLGVHASDLPLWLEGLP